ncbi:MAG: hypothetical protein ACRD0Y_00535, partial [Terriglobales bacterium]
AGERVAAVRRHLAIASLPHSQVIQLRFTAATPQLAAEFLQQMIVAYDQRQAAQTRARAMLRIRFLRQQAQQARAAVLEATRNVAAVARRQDLSDPAHEMQIASQRWQQLAAAETSTEISALQQAATLARRAPSGASDSSYATQGVPKDVLTQRAELSAEVERLAAKYRPQALPLRQARHQLAALDASIAALRRQHHVRAQQALAAVQQQMHDLRAALRNQRAAQTHLRGALAQFDLAQRGLTARQQGYASLLDHLQQTVDSAGAAPPALRVSDPAAALPHAASPRLVSALATALLLGLALGLAAAWWRDHSDDRLRWPEAEELGVAVASVRPRRAALVPDAFAASSAGNGAERCAAALLLAQSESGTAVVLVTSTERGEGKTDLALMLAQCLAQEAAPVLLVDAHVQNPALHEYFQEPIAPGLSELLKGQAAVDLVLRGANNLHYIAAGNGGDLCLALASGTGGDLLTAARARFSWVVIDGPPVLAGPEAGLWSALTDCTLVVSRYELSRQGQVRRGLDALEAAGCRNLALVVNEAPAARCDPARPLWRPQAAAAGEAAAIRMRA